jgi:hydrogenase maturation protease
MFAIIGCGNPNRSDDGVGVVVAQRLLAWLAEAPRDDVRVFDAGTTGVEVMFMARGAMRLVIVDACSSGAEPGAIFEVPGAEFDDRHASMTLHDFRWENALHAGRRIFKEAFPEDVTVLLVEAETLALGLELSAPVAKAAEQVTARIREMVEGFAIVRAKGGSLYLDVGVVERFYRDVTSVALLERDGALWILPVRAAGGGGLILKQRNVKGDRVIPAIELLRQRGLDHPDERALHARYDPEWAALVVDLAALTGRP